MSAARNVWIKVAAEPGCTGADAADQSVSNRAGTSQIEESVRESQEIPRWVCLRRRDPPFDGNAQYTTAPFLYAALL